MWKNREPRAILKKKHWKKHGVPCSQCWDNGSPYRALTLQVKYHTKCPTCIITRISMILSEAKIMTLYCLSGYMEVK